jgi:hypothetical protein
VEIDGLPVGHLSRKNAREYRRMLETKPPPQNHRELSRGHPGRWDRGDGDRGMFGVRLDLPTS